MPTLRNAVRLLLASAGNLVFAGPAAFRRSLSFVPLEEYLTKRAATDPLCQFNPFYCDLATNKFCIGSTCDPSGTVSIEIRGTSSSCASISATDPIVVITFSTVPGFTYIEEHIFVGATSDPIPQGNGNFDFTSPDCCTVNTSPAVCTIPLSVFLAGAGINSPARMVLPIPSISLPMPRLMA